MKKLLIFFSSLILISYSGLSIAVTHLADDVFSISDVFFMFNIILGFCWEMSKTVFLFCFYLPSYIFISSLIDTSFGAFMELPAYGYTAATYMSLAYWFGGFFLIMRFSKHEEFAFLLYRFSPFLLAIFGIFFDLWGDQEFTIRLLRLEWLNCLNSEDMLSCTAFFK